MQGGGLQARNAEIGSVVDRRKSPGEIKLHVRRRSCARDRGAEDFKADFRLSKSRSETSVCKVRAQRASSIGKIQVVGSSHIPERIHQDDSGEAGTIF